MSEPAQPIPPDSPPLEISYQTPPREGNAPTLLRLAGIFNLISAGFDLFYGIGMILFACFIYYSIIHAAPGAPAGAFIVPPPGGAPAPAVPVVPPAPAPAVAPAPPVAAPLPPGMSALMAGIYGFPGILSLAVMPVKIIGAIKLLRRGKNAWGWGLAAGIVGAIEIWMLMFCCVLSIIPISAGIYTIIIVSLAHVRAYLGLPNQPAPAAY